MNIPIKTIEEVKLKNTTNRAYIFIDAADNKLKIKINNKFCQFSSTVSGDWRPSNIAMPQDGLVFYMPLDKFSASDNTGNSHAEYEGVYRFETIQGIPCVNMQPESYIRCEISQDSRRTISFWVMRTADGSSYITISNGEWDWGNESAERWFSMGPNRSWSWNRN